MLSFYLSMVDDDNDKEKIRRIYEQYKQLMYKKAYSILRHEQDAQDAVHEAFVRIIKHIHSIQHVDDVKTKHFVMIIAENVSLNKLKAIKNHKTLNLEDIEDTLAKTQSVEFDIIDKEIIKKALNKLPENFYHILCLTDYLGYSVKQAATFLSISEASAYKRLQRARAKMIELLEKEGIFNE